MVVQRVTKVATAPAHFLTTEQLVVSAQLKLADRPGLERKIIKSHHPLVVYIAKRYLDSGHPLNDLVAAGEKGVLHAIDKYETGHGAMFSSYVGQWIRHYIKRFLYEESNTVLSAVNVYNHGGRAERKKTVFYAKFGREPTQEELVRILSEQSIDWAAEKSEEPLTDEKAAEIRARIAGQAARYEQSRVTQILDSLDRPVDQTNIHSRTLHEQVAAEASSQEEVACHWQERERVRAWVSILPTRERRVLMFRYGIWSLQESFTLRDLGVMMGYTFEGIRQVQLRGEKLLKTQAPKFQAGEFPTIDDYLDNRSGAEKIDETLLEENLPILICRAKRRRKTVPECYGVLSDNERTAIQLRLRGAEFGVVEKELGVTREEILALERSALIALAHHPHLR